MGRTGKRRKALFCDYCIYKCYNELTNINKHMNKYKQWYNQITARGQYRITDKKTESHHIIPKCIGGTNDPGNLTNVTLREHFICHWLLTKIYIGKERHQLLKALWMMKAQNQNQTRYNTKITSRVYANLKEEYSILQSQKVSGKNNPMYGDKFRRSEDGKKRQREAILGNNNGSKQPEARAKIVASKLGKKRKPFSIEHKTKMSESKQGENNSNYGKIASDETRKKIGDRIRGRKQTPEEKLARSLANMGKTREKKLCVHCNTMIAVNGYVRWHGANCKQKADN